MAMIELDVNATKKEEKPDPATANLRFPGNQPLIPQNWGVLTIDRPVTVILQGVVKGVSHYESEWDTSRNLEMQLVACEIYDEGEDRTAETLYPDMAR